MSSGPAERSVAREVASWPGVTVSDNARGGMVFTVGQVELGHLHGTRLAHLPFPRAVRDRLMAEGRVGPHPVLPGSGWSERRIADPADHDDVIALFRLNYDRARQREDRRSRLHSTKEQGQ